MKTLKTIFSRFTRDFVDTLLFFSVIAILIKTTQWLVVAIGALFCLYILGTMWRMGADSENLNEYVEDDAIRAMLKLRPYALRNRPLKRNWKEWAFIALWITILILYITLA